MDKTPKRYKNHTESSNMNVTLLRKLLPIKVLRKWKKHLSLEHNQEHVWYITCTVLAATWLSFCNDILFVTTKQNKNCSSSNTDFNSMYIKAIILRKHPTQSTYRTVEKWGTRDFKHLPHSNPDHPVLIILDKCLSDLHFKTPNDRHMIISR